VGGAKKRVAIAEKENRGITVRYNLTGEGERKSRTLPLRKFSIHGKSRTGRRQWATSECRKGGGKKSKYSKAAQINEPISKSSFTS